MGNTSHPLIHENFDIKENSPDKRSESLREERYFSESKPCYLKINEKDYRVTNYSAFGIVIICESESELENKLYDIPFIYNNVDIAHLDIQKARIESQEEGYTTIAYEIFSDPIDMDKLDAVNAANKVIHRQKNFTESTSNIPPEVKAQVYEMEDWLEHLMAEINQIEENINPSSNKSVVNYEETVISIIAKYLGQVFPQAYNKYEETLRPYPEEIHNDAVKFLRQKLNHIIYQAPFAERVFNKPLGYAGDYEMMNLIYKQENVGKSLFAQCLHRYYINEPAAQAVRNRADYLVNVITRAIEAAPKDRPYRILSVACGPAMEWQQLIPTLPNIEQEIIVDLLDQDKTALLDTQNKLKQLCRQHSLPITFQFINKAIKNIIARGTDYKEYDLVYSAGLFDYLSDPIANTAAKKMFESVKPGGKMVIGNFNVDNPNKAEMDYALDWKLIYRSENDLLSLFSDIGGKLSIEKEKLNLNLFCLIQKNDGPAKK